MKLPFYVECCAATDGTSRVFYRYQCRCCPLHGEWLTWLSDAETDGERHRRDDHNEGAVRA